MAVPVLLYQTGHFPYSGESSYVRKVFICRLHQLAEHILELVDRSSSRVARFACVSSCGLCEEIKILFLKLLKLCRDAYVDGELADSINSCLAVCSLIHSLCVYAESLSDSLELLACVLCVELHNDRKHHSACNTVRCVIDSAECVSHGMSDAETYVGICHSCYVLSQSHALAAVRIILNCLAEVLADELDGLKVENVGELPCSGCCVAFDCMCQSVHTCGSCEALLRYPGCR